MLAQRSFSPAHAIAENLCIAFLMVVMWSVISLDGNRQQESFNRGGIYVVAGCLLVYLVAAIFLMGRPMTGGRAWFIRRGGMCLMLAGMLLYIAIMSLWFGRFF